jgi:nucleotide-binding universal stress UspA family protein
MMLTAPLGHRIVVGVDGSESSRSALHWAAQLAEVTGSSLEALTAWKWPLSLGRGMPLPLSYDPATDAATMLHQAVAEEVVRAHPGLVTRTKVVEGFLVRALIGASKNADLLVVGGSVHRGVVGGRLTAHSLARAHSPVVIVGEGAHEPTTRTVDATSSASRRSITVSTV